METTFTFRNIESTEAIRQHTEGKLEKLKKYLLKPISAHVIFNVIKHNHQAEITLMANGGRYVGSAESTDMYASIDGAVDKIISQLKKDREKTKGHRS